MKNPYLHRFSQLIGLLLGARIFTTLLLTFALYVSVFFLFNREESLRNFVFDYRVHGIIFCTILSILAGGIINQFYDREKDSLTRPLRTSLQAFLKQKYFLYAYLFLNTISLGIAFFISPHVFIFFLVYQFLMWFYSHKLSKIIIVNNLSFVALTVYPFFGMLVYYKTFSVKIFLMALFLFLILLICDVMKDLLTKNADKIFGYSTIANHFSTNVTKSIISIFTLFLMGLSLLIVFKEGIHSILSLYFALALLVFPGALFLLWRSPKKFTAYSLTLVRFWIFIGIWAMLLDGVIERF